MGILKNVSNGIGNKILNWFLMAAVATSVYGCGISISRSGKLDFWSSEAVDVSPGGTYELSLKRERQQVRRFDCDNQLVSDRIEEVTTANAIIYFHPRVGLSGICDSDYKNLNVSGAAGIYGMSSNFHNIGDEKTTLRVDISSAAFAAMQVKPGMNTIEYKYYDCDIRTDENGKLVQENFRVIEEDKIYLNVKYSERTLPGSLDLHKPDSECTADEPTE